MVNLEGKFVVVTGGSSGIGERLVRQARATGANVLATYNHRQEEANKIAGETGAVFFQFPLGNVEDVRRFLDGCGKRKADYFIANAGVEFSGSLEEHDALEMPNVINTNLLGNLYLLREIITQGFMNKGGQISVIGSIAAGGNHDQLAYSASKAGLRGAIGSLRYESRVKEQDLGIKLLEPAFVEGTGMTSGNPQIEKVVGFVKRMIARKGGNPDLVMSCDKAASEILSYTIDSARTGVFQIPEGADIHQIRATYLSR